MRRPSSEPAIPRPPGRPIDPGAGEEAGALHSGLCLHRHAGGGAPDPVLAVQVPFLRLSVLRNGRLSYFRPPRRDGCKMVPQGWGEVYSSSATAAAVEASDSTTSATALTWSSSRMFITRTP